MKLRNLSLVAVALLAYAAPSAKAGFVDTLTPNVLNGYHDASFEFMSFANPTVGLQVGDTFIGFLQINIKETPNSLSTFNQIYAVVSDQVTSIAADGKSFTVGATAAANPNSLQS